MLDRIPSEEEMTALVGTSLYEVWKRLCAFIEEAYDMECLWNKGGKAWNYEYKYRRGGKTLCALYARENCVGFLVIKKKESFPFVVKLSYETKITHKERKLPMYKRIQQFHEKGIKNIEKIFMDFLQS